MVWRPTDFTGSADNFNSAYAFRQTDNAVERWTERGRMSSISWDFRDPIDVGSVTQPRRYIIPEYRLTPGTTSIRIRMRHQVTDVAGVEVRVGYFLSDNVKIFGPATTLTNLTPTTFTKEISVRDWTLQHNPDEDVLSIFIEIQSNATADPVINLDIIGLSRWFIQTATTGTTTPSLGGITDRIECCSVQWVNAGKGINIPVDEAAGGPYQTVSSTTGGGVEEIGFFVWPAIQGVGTGVVPATAGEFGLFNGAYDSVELQIYARLQFWAISIEELPATVFPTVGQSRRKPIIGDGDVTKATLRPDYPGRAVTHRPLYAEGERMHETQTAIHSLGPYSGSTGLDYLAPTATALKRGTWPCYPSVTWSPGDSTTKILFGCRVGDDPEFRTSDGATTRVRRAMTVDVSLIFLGGNHGETQYNLVGATYAAGSGALIYSSPPEPILVTGWSATSEGNDGPPTSDIVRYSLGHPLVIDTAAPGVSSRYIRNNLIGLWDPAKLTQIRRTMIHARFEVFDSNAAHADPEVLIVRCQPVITGAIFGDENPSVDTTRCFVAGWCVTSKQGDPPTAVGV